MFFFSIVVVLSWWYTYVRTHSLFYSVKLSSLSIE